VLPVTALGLALAYLTREMKEKAWRLKRGRGEDKE